MTDLDDTTSRLIRSCGCMVDKCVDGTIVNHWCSEHTQPLPVETLPGPPWEQRAREAEQELADEKRFHSETRRQLEGSHGDYLRVSTERDHLKAMLETVHQHVAEACTMLGVDPKQEPADTWTLRARCIKVADDLERARGEAVFFAERLDKQDHQYSSAHPQAAMYRHKREALEAKVRDLIARLERSEAGAAAMRKLVSTAISKAIDLIGDAQESWGQEGKDETTIDAAETVLSHLGADLGMWHSVSHRPVSIADAGSALLFELASLREQLREHLPHWILWIEAETVHLNDAESYDEALEAAKTMLAKLATADNAGDGVPCRHCGARTGFHGHLGVDGWECHPCWDKRLADERGAK